MAVSYMTKDGYDKILAEINYLETVKRPEISAQIAEARDKGDLSENAEYDAAKEKQGFIEGRIAELESKLSYAHIVDPKELDADGKIVFAATVTLEDCDSEENVTYQIVGDDEADIKVGLISINSPIARGLIGKEVDDVAIIKTPAGDVEYEILEVKYL